MKTRTLLFLLLALLIGCLSGCTKDKPEETTAPTLEVIEPETSETIADKLDETAADFEIQSYYIAPDGSIISAEEMDALEESIRYENSPVLQNSLADEEQDQPKENEDKSSNVESSASSESETGSENSIDKSETSLSESEAEEARNRDFTDEEYQSIQNDIDEWTLQQAMLWSSIFVTLVAKKYHESVTLPSGLRMVYDNH